MVLPDLRLDYTGFMAKQLDGVDIAWIVGLIVSGGSYWLLTRSLDVEREKQAEAIRARAGGGRREGAGPRSASGRWRARRPRAAGPGRRPGAACG